MDSGTRETLWVISGTMFEPVSFQFFGHQIGSLLCQGHSSLDIAHWSSFCSLRERKRNYHLNYNNNKRGLDFQLSGFLNGVAPYLIFKAFICFKCLFIASWYFFIVNCWFMSFVNTSIGLLICF